MVPSYRSRAASPTCSAATSASPAGEAKAADGAPRASATAAIQTIRARIALSSARWANPLGVPRSMGPAGRYGGGGVKERNDGLPGGVQDLDQARRRDRLDHASGPRTVGVAGRCPAEEVPSEHEPGLFVAEHEGAVGQLLD